MGVSHRGTSDKGSSMSNCLCDVVRLLSCCVTCHPNQEVSWEVQSGSTCRSGSPPGSAICRCSRSATTSEKWDSTPGNPNTKVVTGHRFKQNAPFPHETGPKGSTEPCFCPRQHILRCWGRVGYSLRRGGGSRYPLPGDTTKHHVQLREDGGRVGHNKICGQGSVHKSCSSFIVHI